uniref:inverted formin-2-like n=1 Tax=Maylandia zebra TaxID=106582 RepID=UPI000D318D92
MTTTQNRPTPDSHRTARDPDPVVGRTLTHSRDKPNEGTLGTHTQGDFKTGHSPDAWTLGRFNQNFFSPHPRWFILDNTGTHTGNAEGFKISTLLKLTETKANKSRVTLLHHILQEAEENHPDLLNLPDDLEICAKAAGLSLDSIQSETKTLNKRLKNSERSVSSSSDDMKEQYLSTIQESLQAVEQLQLLLSSVEEQRKHLSAYLCEDSSSFSLEELFSTIKAFRDLFLRTLKENEGHREQEKRRKRLEEGRKLREEA